MVWFSSLNRHISYDFAASHGVLYIVNLPSEFSIIRDDAPSITATAEFVVPKSIPMTWPCTFSPSLIFSA